MTEVTRRGVLTCSQGCRTGLKRHPQNREELRKLCEPVAHATPFLLLQAAALNAITDCGVRLSPDLEERFLSGDLTAQERSALAAAVIHTGNGSQHK